MSSTVKGLESSQYDLLNIDESSNETRDSSEDSNIDLPSDILEEGKELKKQIEEEENQKKVDALNEHQSEEKEQHELRYKRLMHLLDRSKFYSNFLLQRMASKKEEEKLKLEKQIKRENGKKLAKEKENEVKEATDSPRTMRTRGHKRQTDEPVPEVPEIKPKKRTRKNVAHSEDNILNVIDEDELQKRASKDEVSTITESKETVPDLFEGGTMRQYQMEGFQWLVALYENGMNGILADEMGLGKTVQCIALVAHLMCKGVVGPFLVCAPLSTLPNWMSEFSRFTPRIPVVLYHGSQDKREDLLDDIAQKYKISGLKEKYFPVVVTSFEVVIKDRNALQQYQWRYIIVDEGHRLKNFQCRLVQELKKYPSSNRLLLTGTPLQNNLTELWSLLNFLLPEIFDDLYVFQAWFNVEELQGSDADQKIVEMERKEHVLSMLHQILSPFLLRRVKTDVDLQIPPKKELLVYCPMSTLQEKLYRATVDKTITDLVGLTPEKEEVKYETNGRPKRQAKKKVDYRAMGDSVLTDEGPVSARRVDKQLEEWIRLSHESSAHSSQTSKKKPENKMMATNIKMQNPVMQLRKIVNHPYLVQWPLDPKTGDYMVNEEMIQVSGKLAVLDQMLERLLKDGHKVLIFSQMTMMLDILADYLDFKAKPFARLDGSMNLDDRRLNMDSFSKDPDVGVFLVSTRAGGLGINLTAADTVVIYDSDWNPQADLQAQDRCHRIGQTRPVVVYRLVTSDTIDQRIIDRASAKRKLEKMVIQKGKFKTGLKSADGTGLSLNELVELLNARDYTGEHRGVSGNVFSEEEIDALMDRSDLLVGEGRPKVKEEVIQLEGVFKRMDQNQE